MHAFMVGRPIGPSFRLLAVVVAVTLAACQPTGSGEDSQSPASQSPAGSGVVPSAATASDAVAANDILIGIAQPLSGPNAQGGLETLTGLEVAVDLVNNPYPDIDLPFAATSGIPCMGGAKLRLVVTDHAADPQKGATAAEYLITEKHVHLLGDMNFSGPTGAAQPVAERYGIPFISSTSTSANLHKQGYKTWFRTGPHDEIYIQKMFEFLQDLSEAKGVTFKTLGLIHENSLFGQTSADVARALAPDFGLEVVEELPYSAQASTLSSEVLRLKSANPDVVLMTSYLADAVLIITTLKDLDYAPPVLLALGSIGQPGFIDSVGAEAEGLIIRASFGVELIDSDRNLATLAEMYTDRAGLPMGIDSPLAMQNILVIADILNRACSTEPAAILKAALETDIPASDLLLPWDGVQFDQETHTNIKAGAVMRQLQDSAYVTVWPFDLAAADVIYPLAPWSSR